MMFYAESVAYIIYKIHFLLAMKLIMTLFNPSRDCQDVAMGQSRDCQDVAMG